MFEVGDKIFYPLQGVGEVIQIVDKEIGDNVVKFFRIKIFKSQITLFIPVDKTEENKIRPLISSDELDNLYGILKENGHILTRKKNIRYKNYYDKLKTGDIYKSVEVLRNLLIIQNNTGLTPREKGLMEKTLDLIVEELSYSANKDIDKDEIATRLTSHFKDNSSLN